MRIINNTIELTEEEQKAFNKQFKIGIVHQLYKENLFSSEQLNEVLQDINK
ncbi:UNVERIFIED_CONTAM: hypothetical protein Cloal_1013 [Acetivibrio alkalicellulosi]